MKVLKNFLLSILFFISFTLVVFCFTVLNKNFIYRVLDNNNYYDKVYKHIKVDMDGVSYKLSKSDLKKDIKNYVKNRYDNTFYTNKISVKTNKVRELYNYHVRFKNKLLKYDISLISFGIYILCLVFISITGYTLIKTKGSHNILIILVFNNIFTFVSFVILKNINLFKTDIFVSVKNSFLNYYIITSIVLIVVYGLLKIKKRLLK